LHRRIDRLVSEGDSRVGKGGCKEDIEEDCGDDDDQSDHAHVLCASPRMKENECIHLMMKQSRQVRRMKPT
jgi:hypothetical protein